MITIIHGENSIVSRSFFLEQKKRSQFPIMLQGDTLTITDLAQIFEGGELFEQTKYVFIEHFFSKRKKSKERDAIASYIADHAASHTVYFWEDKEIDQKSLSLVNRAEIKNFRLPQQLFSFLDAIKPGNGKNLVALFHQTLAATEVEMVFFMLVRQFRLMLALANNTGNNQNTISELKRLAPWQKNKLEAQVKPFQIPTLIAIYKKLFVIESEQKTGTLSGSLTSAIDFLLLAL